MIGKYYFTNYDLSSAVSIAVQCRNNKPVVKSQIIRNGDYFYISVYSV